MRISGATKRGQELLARAKKNEGTELYHVYGKFSSAKAQAMADCRRWCYETNGYNFHIISHNCDYFSVAWNYDDPETGELMTRIETKFNTYIVDGSR